MYTKKSKLIGAMLAIIMILQIVCTSFTSVVFATEDANTVTFEDEKLYEAVKVALGEKIKEKNDETKTIIVNDITKIVSLDLSQKGITDLSGIEKFVSLKTLNLFDNKIEKLDTLSSLTSLEELNLTNNNIEDCTVLTNLTNLTTVSIGSQDLERVAIVNKNDITEELGVKSFTYTLPQVFKYIYDIKNANKESIDLSLNILSADSSNGLGNSSNYVLYEDSESNALKLKVTITNQESAKVEIKYNSGVGQDTKLILNLLAITEDEKIGIKFEDENLYNAVKANIEGTAASSYTDSEYPTIRDDNSGCIWYDNILTLVINKHYIYKDITTLDLVDKKIKDLEGLQYFVALSELDLSNNYIANVSTLKEFAAKKAEAETDLRNIISAKTTELMSFVDKKEEYNKLLSNAGKKDSITKKIAEIKTYINGLNEETTPSIDSDAKSALTSKFLNNIQADLFLNDNSRIDSLVAGTKTNIKEKDIEIDEDTTETAYYQATISDTKIKVYTPKKEQNGNITHDVETISNIDSSIVDNICEKLGDIKKINNGQCEETAGNWVNIAAKRSETVASITNKLAETEKYYDIENLLLILPKETLDLTAGEINNLYLEEKRILAAEYIKDFIDAYDLLTEDEIRCMSDSSGICEKEDLEEIYKKLTDSNAEGYVGKDKTMVGFYYLKKQYMQSWILSGTYYKIYDTSNSQRIEYNEYIEDALKEISDTYINDANDSQNRKDIQNIITRMKNIDLERVVALPKIKNLNLSTNNIKDISELTDMTTLITLNLSDNIISDISSVDFTKFEKLQQLNLSHNRIYEAKIGNINALHNLNLSNNYLSNTSGIDFRGFVNLERLDVSGNRIYDLQKTMYNLYELSRIQSQAGKTKILDWTNTTGILSEWTEVKEFGYVVNTTKVNIANQTIYASATKKLEQNKEEYVYLPEIFNQVKDITCGTTNFTNAKSTNDGMVLYLDTSILGEQTNSATIEGTGIAAGTTCYVNYTVATKAEVNEIPVTGIQIQLEKTLTDNENAMKPDFNGDSKVNSEDLEIFNRYWLGSITLNEAQENLAKNIVPDNLLTPEDHLLLVKYVQNGWDNNKLTDEQRQKAEEADITADEEVTNDDFIVLSNYLIGGVYSPYTEAQIIAEFDINGDNKVTAIDSICMSRYLTSKSTEKINIDTLTLEMLNDYKGSKQLYAKLSPENTTQKDIEWVSHDERIVRVDSTGKVTAVATGTTQITAKSTKNANVYDVISVTVKEAADIVVDIKLKDEANLAKEYYVGQELNLEGAKAIITKLSGDEVEIDITKEMVKGFDTTTVTGEEPRIVTVEYTDEFDTTVQTTFNITVVEFTGEDVVKEIKLVPPTKLEYNKGEELDLTGATVEKVMESGIKHEPVNVTVDMISGYDKEKAGSQTITVTYEGKTATFDVMVNNPVRGINLNKTEEKLFVGGVVNLTTEIIPSDAVNQNVTWASNNENVATVDNTGKITAVGVGEAIITVTTEDGEKTATCKVTVKEMVYELGDGYIANISPDTNETKFFDTLNSTKTYTILKTDETRQTIATGDKLVDENGNEIATLVVKGDINGDGEVDGVDATAIIYHVNGKQEITDSIKQKAADINGGGIDMTDWTRVIYHYIGINGYTL